jgi:hypothetical protein
MVVLQVLGALILTFFLVKYVLFPMIRFFVRLAILVALFRNEKTIANS